MMERDPRRQESYCADIHANCAHYTGAVHFDGRRMVEGSGRFIIRNKKTFEVFYEGAPTENGRLNWRRVSGAPTMVTGDFYPSSGYFNIHFVDPQEAQDGEEIVFQYEWIPHHLHGAEVQVRVNNEERWVPIIELQRALYSYLGDE